MSNLSAIEARAKELGGEVVELKFCPWFGAHRGVVHWKRPHSFLPTKEEHIVHYFYVRPGSDVAEFEAGLYGSEEFAVKGYEDRCR